MTDIRAQMLFKRHDHITACSETSWVSVRSEANYTPPVAVLLWAVVLATPVLVHRAVHSAKAAWYEA